MIYSIIVLVFGLVIGSFLNVCIYRIPLNQSIVFPASHCPGCQKKLQWWHLIPVLSFLGLEGRCAYCSRKISIRYPLMELINGLLYVLLWFTYGLSWTTLQGFVLVSTLVVVAGIDFDHRIIPNELVVFLMLLSIPLNWLSSNLLWLEMVWGFIVGGGLLLVIALISRGGMGGGDIKLMAALGMYLGWQKVLLAIFFAAVLGSIVGIVLMVVLRKGRKTAIPFGPFLAIGTLVCYLWSEPIINWYLGSIV